MIGNSLDSQVATVVAATVFAIMFRLGLAIPAGDLRRVWQPAGPMLRGLAAVLIVVPLLALAITQALDPPRAAQIGIVLMAISPSAPVALRRSLDAGGDRAFAPSLQICAALLAVVSLPLSIVALDAVYDGHASIMPWHVARQVFVAQLLPLALGIALRHFKPVLAARLERTLGPVAAVLLVLALVLVVLDAWALTATAGWRVAAAIVLVTCAALAAGHLFGGREPSMQTAVAIASAARNPGLALLVAAQNDAPAAVNATILAYLFVSFLVIGPYALWRRRFRRPAH